jgi:hypothetical protein
LYLPGCSKLKELPTSIDKLATLKLLDLLGCSQLNELIMASTSNHHVSDVE